MATPSAAPDLTLAPSPDEGLALRYFTVTAKDGTELQAWTNDVEGPTVLLCNGLGTNPYAWPALLDPRCGVRVVSWNERGVGGSARPEDSSHVGVGWFMEDALAVMDAAGIGSCVVAGWSIGVNTMFELALRHPERVTGLFAVAGVPGDSFATMLAPVFVPRALRKHVATTIARALKLGGKPLSAVARRLPVGPRSIAMLSHTGFMLPIPDHELGARAVREFLSTPVDWYMHLALHSSLHPRISLRNVRVPTTFVAGRYDVLAGAGEMRTASERIPGAAYVELRASHFVPMEKPGEVHELLLDLLDRVEQQEATGA
jgi:pimeloyl-ACP methyl ester carboxylesterase